MTTYVCLDLGPAIPRLGALRHVGAERLGVGIDQGHCASARAVGRQGHLTEHTIKANAAVLAVGVPVIITVGRGGARGVVVRPVLRIVSGGAIKGDEGSGGFLVDFLIDGVCIQLFLNTVVAFLPGVSERPPSDVISMG